MISLRKQSLLTILLLTALGMILAQDEAVHDWLRRGGPPHPYLMPAGVAAWRLTTVPLDDQFTHTFYYGEECGKHLTLEQAVARGMAVPKKLQDHFFDGVGHGFAPPENIIETIEQISAHVPGQHLNVIHDGVMRHHAMINKGDPEKVVPFARQYLRLSGIPNPYNGVRIGLQRSLGDQLPEALEVAATYPEHYWPALFEELGWRASRHRPPRTDGAPKGLLDDDEYWADAMEWVLLHIEHVPKPMRCHYLHGAARGRALGYPWSDEFGWARIQDEIDGFEESCRQAAFQGIGWAVFIQAAHKPRQVKTMLQNITDEQGRNIAEETMAQVEASLNNQEGEPLTLWDLDNVKIGTPSEVPPNEDPSDDRP